MAKHSVQIDEDAILVDLAALGGAAGEWVEGEHIPHEPPPEPGNWKPVADIVAGFLVHKVAPNWQVPRDTEQQWSDALAGVAEDMFPGGMGNVEQWGPWAKFGLASVMVVLAGIDTETMTLKPLRPPDKEAPPAEDAPDQQHQTATSGRFTTEE